MPYRLLEDAGYSGMNREESAWLLKPGMVYDAQNIIFDKVGVARHRGPSTAIFSGAQTAAITALQWVYQQDSAATNEELFGIGVGGLYYVNKATGALTLLNAGSGSTPLPVYRPIRHFGFVVFPYVWSIGTATALATAGATSSVSFSSPTAGAVLSATTSQVTLGGADLTTNIKVGCVVNITSATQQYYGRVVSIDSTTKFTVWPKPAVSITGVALSPSYTSGLSFGNLGGHCGCSFQNRLLLGNTVNFPDGLVATNQRVYFSPILTETGTSNTGIIEYGCVFLRPDSWPPLNYFELPTADPIVSLEPINDGELLILTTGAPWVLRGQLATQTTTFAPGITYDLSPINLPANCLSDLSVQRTPRGVIWAGSEGIWVYGGGGRQPYSPGWRLPYDITEGAIHTYWRSLVRGANFAIHGSFQTRNHYVLSGSSGGSTFCLAYNFGSGAWSTLSGVGTDIFYGVPKPSDPSQCHVSRWYDTSGAAPSMTNGQVLRADSMFQPYTAGTTKTDADGSTIPLSLTTRAITDEMTAQKIIRRMAVRYQMAASSAAVAVAAGTRIDPADSVGTPTVSLGSLSATNVRTITAATNATPIVCTTATHGLQTGDTVDIHGGTGLTAINGRWRIKVLSSTTFSLDQSIGNGVYNASTATVKKVTEQEFEASSLDMGQAVYVTFSGSPDDFELHGIRVSAMEIPWGMAR